MPFNTTEFFLFLAVVLVLFYPRAWRSTSCCASYYFYASWNAKFIALLADGDRLHQRPLAGTPAAGRGAGGVDFQPGRQPRVPGLLQYYNSWPPPGAGHGAPPRSFFLEIVLPRHRFHTFQSISYVVDVYRGRQRAVQTRWTTRSSSAFSAAGGQPDRSGRAISSAILWTAAPRSDDLSRGVFLIALGLTRRWHLPTSLQKWPTSISQPRRPPRCACGVGACSLSITNLFRFSGYTDMAIGIAKLFGFHFPINFRRPYLAGSITDFWRRWHISLSSWLRDYLYIPSAAAWRPGSPTATCC
jgi:alginate O-acetyltransferase complex protein AlgI